MKIPIFDGGLPGAGARHDENSTFSIKKVGVRGGYLLSANKFQKINSAKNEKVLTKLKIPIDSFS